MAEEAGAKVAIENLAEVIDETDLSDTFSCFGEIAGCEIVTDPSGKRKGFVSFVTTDAATKAVKRVDGMLLGGRRSAYPLSRKLEVNSSMLQLAVINHIFTLQSFIHPRVLARLAPLRFRWYRTTPCSSFCIDAFLVFVCGALSCSSSLRWMFVSLMFSFSVLTDFTDSASPISSSILFVTCFVVAVLPCPPVSSSSSWFAAVELVDSALDAAVDDDEYEGLPAPFLRATRFGLLSGRFNDVSSSVLLAASLARSISPFAAALILIGATSSEGGGHSESRPMMSTSLLVPEEVRRDVGRCFSSSSEVSLKQPKGSRTRISPLSERGLMHGWSDAIGQSSIGSQMLDVPEERHRNVRNASGTPVCHSSATSKGQENLVDNWQGTLLTVSAVVPTINPVLIMHVHTNNNSPALLDWPIST
jgi:hypothetical protein